MPYPIFLGLVYSISIILWGRYLYIKSFKTPRQRANLAHSLIHSFVLIPLGLQAIFLFCFAVGEFLPLIFSVMDKISSGKLQSIPVDLFEAVPLRIIFTGSLLLALQYIFFKKIIASEKYWRTSGTIILLLVFIFILHQLVKNISNAVPLSYEQELVMNLGNGFAMALSLVIIIVALFAKNILAGHYAGKFLLWSVKLSLAYLGFVMLAATPAAIFKVLDLFA